MWDCRSKYRLLRLNESKTSSSLWWRRPAGLRLPVLPVGLTARNYELSMRRAQHDAQGVATANGMADVQLPVN